MFRFKVVLQACPGAVGLPTVLAVQQQLLQLRLFLATLLCVIQVAHDAGETTGASLKTAGENRVGNNNNTNKTNKLATTKLHSMKVAK